MVCSTPASYHTPEAPLLDVQTHYGNKVPIFSQSSVVVDRMTVSPPTPHRE